jgi:hypothetical protein
MCTTEIQQNGQQLSLEQPREGWGAFGYGKRLDAAEGNPLPDSDQSQSDPALDFAKSFGIAFQKQEGRFTKAFSGAENLMREVFDLGVQVADITDEVIQFLPVFRNSEYQPMASDFLKYLCGPEAERIQNGIERSWTQFLTRVDPGRLFNLDGAILPAWLQTRLQMASDFLNYLCGPEGARVKNGIERSWSQFLNRMDPGELFNLDDAILPAWLQTRLQTIRAELGDRYSVTLVAHRMPGTNTHDLTIDLQVVYKGVASSADSSARHVSPKATANEAAATGVARVFDQPAKELQHPTPRTSIHAQNLGLPANASLEAVAVEMRLRNKVDRILENVREAIEDAKSNPGLLKRGGLVPLQTVHWTECWYGLNLGEVRTALVCPKPVEPKWYHRWLRESLFYFAVPSLDPYAKSWFASPAFNELLQGIREAGAEPVLKMDWYDDKEIKRPGQIFRHQILNSDDEIEIYVGVRLKP